MTTETAWAHLPNAAHIDRVLADLKARPEVWSAAWAEARSAAWDAVWSVAWTEVRKTARTIVGRTAWDAAWDNARFEAWGKALEAANNAARFAPGKAASDAGRRGSLWGDMERAAERNAVSNAVSTAASDAVGKIVWEPAWESEKRATRELAWKSASVATTALVAWDDCAHLLELEPDALRLLVAHDHPAVLLLPACIALKSKEAS